MNIKKLDSRRLTMLGVLCLSSAVLLAPAAGVQAGEVERFAGTRVLMGSVGTPSYLDVQGLRGQVGQGAGWVERAKAVVGRFSDRYGLADPVADLLGSRVSTDIAGNTHVVLEQRFNGVPVEGARLTVHFGTDGEPIAVTGRAVPQLSLSTTATLVPADAAAIAKAQVGATVNGAQALRTDGVELVIYDPQAVNDARGTDILAYKVTVVGEGVREFVYVDATDGGVAGMETGIHHSRDRLTYDMNHGTNYGAATLERMETTPPVGDTDVDNAHDFAGDTYDFFFNAYARDSIDDNGLTLKSYTHYSVNYQNAFWDGQRMTYGDGFPVDDVTGHEITHGVTERTAGLIYRNQSGALNESFSDIFGEAIDLVNGSGDDSPAVRWLLGEEIPGIGAIRDMQDPTAFGDPDRIGSPLYYCGSGDNGGVHTNSGVPNKNYALLVDGGSFNGRDITAIGLTKASAIHYTSLVNILGPNSTMRDHLVGLWLSCRMLEGTDLPDPVTGQPSGEVIDADDCRQVIMAGLAVELLKRVCRR